MQRTTLSRTPIASLALLATLGVLAFLYFSASVFITLLSSALIALALEPFVQFVCRKAKIGRRVSSMVVGFFAIAFLYGLFYLLYRSALQFFTDLPILVEQIPKRPLVQGVIDRIYQITETLTEAGRRIAPPPGSAAAKGHEGGLRGGRSWHDA